MALTNEQMEEMLNETNAAIEDWANSAYTRYFSTLFSAAAELLSVLADFKSGENVDIHEILDQIEALKGELSELDHTWAILFLEYQDTLPLLKEAGFLSEQLYPDEEDD